MNDLLNKISLEAKNIKLSTAEKASMKERLLVVMDQKPIQNTSPSLSGLQWFSFLRMHMIPVVLVCFIFLGGISYTSKNSLPGQPLYGIKTSLYEGTFRFLSFTPEKRAYFEVQVLKTRLEEVQSLKVEGVVSPEVEVVNGVYSQAEKAFSRITALSDVKSDATSEVLSEFEAVLLSYAPPQDMSRNMMMATGVVEETTSFSTMSLKAIAPEADMEDDPITRVVNEFLQKTGDIRLKLEE